MRNLYDNARKKLVESKGRQENLMEGHQQALQQLRQKGSDDNEVITQLNAKLAAAQEELKKVKAAHHRKSVVVAALEVTVKEREHAVDTFQEAVNAKDLQLVELELEMSSQLNSLSHQLASLRLEMVRAGSRSERVRGEHRELTAFENRERAHRIREKQSAARTETELREQGAVKIFCFGTLAPRPRPRRSANWQRRAVFEKGP